MSSFTRHGGREGGKEGGEGRERKEGVTHDIDNVLTTVVSPSVVERAVRYCHHTQEHPHLHVAPILMYNVHVWRYIIIHNKRS